MWKFRCFYVVLAITYFHLYQTKSATMTWEKTHMSLSAVVLLGSLSVGDATLPPNWCCMFSKQDAARYPACKNINCPTTTPTTSTVSTTTTTMPATPPPTWSVPLLLDPEAVEVTGNKTRVNGRLISSVHQFEGDILGFAPDHVMEKRNKTGTNFVRNEERHWPNRTVPYEISSIYRPKDKQVIQDALEEFMLKTTVRFRNRKDTDKAYVYIAPGYGCVVNIKEDIKLVLMGFYGDRCGSLVGREGEKQVLSLQVPDCMKKGLIMHELMHVTGFYHEQARTDRDQYVEINWGNIPEDMRNRFQNYADKDVTAFGTPYDFASILHYGTHEFAIDPEEWTIRPRKNRTESLAADQMGQRFGLSETDVEKVKLAYPDESATACPKEKGWKKHRNICYFFSFLTDTPQNTFWNARIFCRKMGATIASEPTETVGEFFKSQMQSLDSEARIYVASCNSISPSNMTVPQEIDSSDCNSQLYFICSKRLSAL